MASVTPAQQLAAITKKIDKMKKNVLKDIQKYTFTVFKNTFKQKTKLKQQHLTGDNLRAFKERTKFDKIRGGHQSRNMLKGSNLGQSPRQDKRKYLSNNVRYVLGDKSAIVYLNVPFGKQLDQGGISQVKQYISPYSWQSIDILKYKGQTLYGKLFKGRLLRGFTTLGKGIKYFRKQMLSVQKYSLLKNKITISRKIEPRPFTGKILNNVLSSGKIKQFFRKYSIR